MPLSYKTKYHARQNYLLYIGRHFSCISELLVEVAKFAVLGMYANIKLMSVNIIIYIYIYIYYMTNTQYP